MSQCSDCYNGCSEISSDKCIKYTGVNVPLLDIKTGDSLSWVEQTLITFLTSTINGTGIQITIDPADYCAVVTQYLQACETVTALDLFKALVKAACDLQSQVTATNAILTTLNGDYTIDCLTGVTASSDTHDIVQAVITKLCAVNTTLTALALDVDTNYVKLADLNGLIAAYIASTSASTKYSTRMVPYAAVEYYGPLTGFDASGAGLVGTDWEDIYLCNGDNGTPDKRGRVAVGATSTPGVVPFDAAVNPAVAGNPAYALLTKAGANTITLDATQIPAHAHTATSAVSPNPHSHNIFGAPGDDTGSGTVVARDIGAPESAGSTQATALTVSTTVDASTGGGLAHANNQPAIACYYIIYIP